MGGFKTNGYELHLEVMLQEGSGEISGYRNRIAGFDYLHKKGFDSLRGDTGETEDITGVPTERVPNGTESLTKECMGQSARSLTLTAILITPGSVLLIQARLTR